MWNKCIQICRMSIRFWKMVKHFLDNQPKILKSHFLMRAVTTKAIHGQICHVKIACHTDTS